MAFQLKSTWANANVSISIDNKCSVIHSVTVSLSQCLSISTSIFRVLFTPKRSLSFNIYICNVYVAVYNVMHGICAFGIEMWMGASCERPQFFASWLIFLMEFQCYFNGMPNDKSTQPIQMDLLAELLFTYPQNERKSICDQNDQSRRMKTVRICNVFLNAIRWSIFIHLKLP